MPNWVVGGLLSTIEISSVLTTVCYVCIQPKEKGFMLWLQPR